MPGATDTTQRFEQERSHLRGVAYRMLGSLSEADDAVQETWLRLQRVDPGEIENLRAWCTTVITRICLNLLRSRTTRREDPLGVQLPDPVVRAPDDTGPEHDALLADSVGLALLVVLETLSPAERVAFVLHDVFAMPFDEIAGIVDRTPAAARQLASRARRRVQSAGAEPDSDLIAQHAVVDAFFAAARAGDLEGLLRVLDPDVVTRQDAGHGTHVTRGAEAVARRATGAAKGSGTVHPVLVNGVAGALVIDPDRGPVGLLAFTIRGGRIIAIDALNDTARLAALDLPSLS